MLDNRERRQLQRLMSDKDWPTVDKFVEEFLKENFLATSVKRESEFDTMWYLAFNEGGKFFINKLLTELENEAHQAE